MPDRKLIPEVNAQYISIKNEKKGGIKQMQNLDALIFRNDIPHMFNSADQWLRADQVGWYVGYVVPEALGT
jgi:hypothetical protein